MKIHVSEVTGGALSEYPYVTEERGTIEVKVRGGSSFTNAYSYNYYIAIHLYIKCYICQP